jgi:hypothetical protein
VGVFRAWPAAAAAAHALSACPPRVCSIASRAAMAGLVTAWQPAPVPERVGPMGELRVSEHRYGRHNARRHRRRRVLGLYLGVYPACISACISVLGLGLNGAAAAALSSAPPSLLPSPPPLPPPLTPPRPRPSTGHVIV